MGLSSLPSLIAEYHTEPAGVVSSQLIDQSGFGEHLDLVFGTPLYATRDGIEMMNFDNSFWFRGRNPMRSGGSVVVVGALSMIGSEGSLSVANTFGSNYPGNDYTAAGLPSEADKFSSTFQVKSLSFGQGRNVIVFDRTGIASPGAVWANGQANLFCGCFDIDTQTVIGARGSDAPASNAVATGATTAREGRFMEVGHLRAAAGYPTAGYCSTKRIYFFAENIFNDPDFATARADEISMWGI